VDGEENLDRLGEDIVGMRSLNAKSRLHMPSMAEYYLHVSCKNSH